MRKIFTLLLLACATLIAQPPSGWAKAQAFAVSLGVVTTVFAIWNYRVNFRTDHGFRECLARYLVAIAFCFALNYAITLSGIKHFGTTRVLEYGIIAVVQVLVSGVKFALYHRWVYPQAAMRTVAEMR